MSSEEEYNKSVQYRPKDIDLKLKLRNINLSISLRKKKNHSEYLTLNEYIINAKSHGEFLEDMFYIKSNWQRNINQVKEKLTKGIERSSKLISLI